MGSRVRKQGLLHRPQPQCAQPRAWPVLRGFVLVLLALLASCAAQTSGWSTVSGMDVQFLVTSNGTTYAFKNNTEIAGQLLGSSQQPTAAACAESCDANENCDSFNYCGIPNGCLADPNGGQWPSGYCQQLVATTIASGAGVLQQASGNPLLGQGGLKVKVDNPGPLEGYVQFAARSLLSQYDVPCNGTVTPNKCTLSATLVDAGQHCNSLPECFAFTFGPKGRDGIKGPLATFKSSSDPEERVDMTRSTLTALAYVYVKADKLGSFPTSTPDSGASHGAGASAGGDSLSGGAIAGIVVGTITGCAAVFAIALILWRRRRRISRAGPRADTERGRKQGSGVTGWEQKGELEATTFGVSATDLTAGLPTDKTLLSEVIVGLEDTMIPRQAIEIVHMRDGRPCKLGGGASGDVYRVLLHGSTPAACKVFKFADSCSSANHFLKEADLLRQLTHANIVHFLGISLAGDQGLLVMELMYGDLASSMHNVLPGGRGRMFGWYNRGWRVALQIAAGLEYLHVHRIVHLDLKPQNVLLTKDGEAKIGDVGFSRILRENWLSTVTSRMGTFNWVAPELLLGEKANEKADIYSYGIILWELCTGELPTRGTVGPLSSPEHCPSEVAELQRRCVAADPEDRPTASEIVEALRRWQRRDSPQAAKGGAQPASEGGSIDGHRVVRSVLIRQPENGAAPVAFLQQRQQQQTGSGAASVSSPWSSEEGRPGGASGSVFDSSTSRVTQTSESKEVAWVSD